MNHTTESKTEEPFFSTFIQRAFYSIVAILLAIGIGGPLIMRLLELAGI